MRWAALGVMLAALISGVTNTGFAQKPSSPQTLENLLQEEKPDDTAQAVEAAKVDDNPQPVRPAGTFVRPKNGYKHPDLDKAWAEYDSAVEKATATLRDAISKQRMAAREAGDLSAAKKCKAILDALVSKGQLPEDDKMLQKQVKAAQAAFNSAAGELAKTYKAVVVKLVKDATLNESVAEAVEKELQAIAIKPPLANKQPPDARGRWFHVTNPNGDVLITIQLRADGTVRDDRHHWDTRLWRQQGDLLEMAHNGKRFVYQYDATTAVWVERGGVGESIKEVK